MTNEELRKHIDSNTEQIVNDLRNLRICLTQNMIDTMFNRPLSHPELSEEAHRKRVEEDRKTHLYGYGVSFQDDREHF